MGDIGNYYGGLHIARLKRKHYWAIENYDGFGWEEIPAALYRELLKRANR